MNILMLASFNLKSYDLENLKKRFLNEMINIYPSVMNLIDGIIRQNHSNFTLVGWSGKVNRNYEYKDNNLRILLLKSPKPVMQILSRFRANINQLKENIDLDSIDIIHSHESNRLSIIASKLNKPWLITNHGLVYDSFKGVGRNKIFDKQFLPFLIIERICFLKAKHMICVSPSVQNEVKRIKKKIITYQIDNAIARDFFYKKSSLINNNILFIGSVTINKQLDIIIKALEYVPSARLRIIYQYFYEEYMEYVKKLITEKGMENRIDFLGLKSKTEIIDELYNSSILILTSKYESFGMVFAEAMASGVPVIGTNVAGIPHLIKDGYNGFLINVGDYRTLAEKINYLFKNRDKLMEMGNNAYNTVRERWHPDLIAGKTLEVYRKILNK